VASGVLDKGTTLAGYRIDGILGQGGMGVVYEATQLSLDRVVALKVLASHLTEDITFIQRFQREGQIQAKIDHPNIVTVFDSGKTDEGFFIAMRLVRGPNLKDMIVARELDPGRTMRILTPVADALDTAHQAGLIHRDIKPQNVLVGGRDQAYLADFGLTKASGDKSLTKTGQFVGTLDYISPEQIKGDHATTSSDVYALAAVLYECLTGVVPFPKDSEAAVLYAHMADPPPEVTKERPDLPGGLDEVLIKAMDKDPANRYDSPTALLEDINRAFDRRTRAAFTPPGPIEVPEETGIRAAEVDVSTRETPTQGPGETSVSPVQPETDAGPAETRVGETAPAEPSETVVGETQVSPGETRVSPGETQVSPGETRASPGETRVSPGETKVTPGETKASPQETRAAKAVPAETKLGAAAEAADAPAKAPPTERKGVSPILIGAGVALLALVVIGFLLGSSGGGDEESDSGGGRAVTAGALEFSTPEDWRAASKPAEIPGLSFEGGATTLAPNAQAAEGTMSAGFTDATGPALLPAGMLESLSKPPEQNDPVKLGDLEAWRYRDLKPEGFDQSLTMYVVPTTEGVATVSCAAPAGKADAFLPDCEGAATSLVLTTGDAYPLGPDEDYLEALDNTIGKLNSERSRQTQALRRARTGPGQARAARSLRDSYSAAAKSLGGLEISPAIVPANAALVKALRKTSAGYNTMAGGARANSRSRYNRGLRTVRAGERDVNAALKALGEGGG
jgi:serine/threonine protein kinase